MKSFAGLKTCRAAALLAMLLVVHSCSIRSSTADEASLAAAARYSEWKHSGSVYILTTPEGADLPATAAVEGFPLLIRLHKDFFDFSQAQANGEDLRFSSSAGEPLAFQIDHWDAAQGVASIWVRMPIVRGAAREQLRLHWGNADAASESSGKAVFNESNGYLSVWHMRDSAQDEVGTLTSSDTGTTATDGMIGAARHLPGGKGLFCGDKIPNYPTGASAHSSEAWFRAEQPNATIFGWGNEGGGRGSKVRMQLRSPPHVHVDSDFADVNGESRLPLGEWIHVAHTYNRDDGRIYINGRLDGAAKPPLAIKSPARMWIGGWYNHYDFVGDIDEVRISHVARSADWIKLQYENQRRWQTVVGPIVQPGSEFSISRTRLAVAEGQSATISARAGGAQKIYWIAQRDGRETVVATDRFSYTFDAGRVVGNESLTLQFKAIYADEVKTNDIAITIQEAIPEPVFTLSAPAVWDGRQTIEIAPQISNRSELQTAGAAPLNFAWTVDDVAVIKRIEPGKLILKRAQNSGPTTITAAIDNGGKKIVRSTTIIVTEPAQDPWAPTIAADDEHSDGEHPADEHPEDGQFFARDDKNEGTLCCRGTLAADADSVFLRIYADEQLIKTEIGTLSPDKKYSLAAKLKPGLIKYRVEFGSKSGDRETLLRAAKNLVCGDAYLIDGQSNAEATDVGPNDPAFSSDWIRSFGATAGDAQGARWNRWGNAVVRDRNGGKAQIGSWGMELAKRLVESQRIPICILNGAVGGTRIDQHQRNPHDPTDVSTIYGRLLWRVRQARLTHGIRAVLWHQGENDQGADGPTGGFGWETYRQYFIDMAAAWKEDYPNIQHYYVFQIWPKACSMGIHGSDNRLREVQRTLPKYFSNLSVMSTLGIKPPGGCHYPVAGYAEFARLIGPLVERDFYGATFPQSITAANLRHACFTSERRDELALEFDQNVVWSDSLASQFYLDGQAGQIASGAAQGRLLTLKLKEPSKAGRATYLDSAAWSPDNLLYGENGIAALTFCDVPIEPRSAPPAP